MQRHTYSGSVSQPMPPEPEVDENRLATNKEAARITASPSHSDGGHGDNSRHRLHRRSTFRQNIEKWWMFEIAAWLISLGGLVGITSVLASTNNKPVPNWVIRNRHVHHELQININSVLSLFATLVKSTLLIPVAAGLSQLKWTWFQEGHRLSDFQAFQEAIDGPLGSVMLLWTLRGRRLACLGALIIIATLGLDFSFQQIVNYPALPIQADTAAIPRNNEYMAYQPGPIVYEYLPDSSMQAAIYTGIFNIHNTFDVIPTCSSGNCTFPDTYTSLAICSKCFDVTDSVESACSTWAYDYSSSYSAGAPSVVFNVPNCNYSLPNGLFLEGITDTDQPDRNLLNILYDRATTSHFNPLVWFASMSLLNGTWEWITEKINSTDSFQVLSLVNATAKECGLRLCVNKYQGSVTNGIFQETLLDTFYNDTEQYVGQQLDIPYFITPPAPFSNFSAEKHSDAFAVDPVTYQALQTAFSNYTRPLFNGTVTTNFNGFDVTNDILGFIFSLEPQEVDQMMASLAASMTNVIRTSNFSVSIDLPELYTAGAAWKDTAYVKVRWAWMTLPIILVALSLVFLLATMVRNARNGGSFLWKTGALGAFYNPLTRIGRARIGEAKDLKDLEHIASAMTVKWEDTERGRRLVQIDE